MKTGPAYQKKRPAMLTAWLAFAFALVLAFGMPVPTAASAAAPTHAMTAEMTGMDMAHHGADCDMPCQDDCCKDQAQPCGMAGHCANASPQAPSLMPAGTAALPHPAQSAAYAARPDDVPQSLAASLLKRPPRTV